VHILRINKLHPKPALSLYKQENSVQQNPGKGKDPQKSPDMPGGKRAGTEYRTEILARSAPGTRNEQIVEKYNRNKEYARECTIEISGQQKK
jgi:hypothetical protein